jgi:hypothetical protein
MLLTLEDARERIERFTETVETIAFLMPLIVRRSARRTIREIEPFPVSIHFRNSQSSDWMMGEFEFGGWRYRRVVPIGESGSRRTGWSPCANVLSSNFSLIPASNHTLT